VFSGLFSGSVPVVVTAICSCLPVSLAFFSWAELAEYSSTCSVGGDSCIERFHLASVTYTTNTVLFELTDCLSTLAVTLAPPTYIMNNWQETEMTTKTTRSCNAKPGCSPPGCRPRRLLLFFIGQLIGSPGFSAALALLVVSHRT